MKRYLVFAGYEYYPRGGWGDFVGSFDDLDEAKACSPETDWLEVVDRETSEVIHRR